MRFLPYEIREPADKWVWSLFVTLQVADVWTTTAGLQYDCVSEMNPLLGSRPSVTDMVILKSSVLIPSYGYIHKKYTITNRDLLVPIILTAWTVDNNISVIGRAEKKCNKY